jgi:hypothetical protein
MFAIPPFYRWIAAAVLVVFLSSSAAAVEKNSAYLSALESITTQTLKQHVDYLADDALEGREAGTRGGRTAGDYVRARFQQYQLSAAGADGDYFQPFAPNFRNVLGLLRGSDPKLQDQVIVVGAHYDHIGYGTRRNSRGPIGQIHNGADDNASGASGLLELAEAFSMLPEPPKRSILFAAWDAEEKGLLGTRHWLARPTVPREHVVFALNMDMIGRLRNDELTVFGSRTGYGLRRLICRHNPDLKLSFSWSLRPNADHWSFFEQDIPVLMLHTGLHDQYHAPGDDAELINNAGIRRVARLAFETIHDLANRAEPPRFRPAGRYETPERQRQLANRPVQLNGKPLRVGITWRVDEAAPGTVILTHVVAGSPAALAGLHGGDRIYQIAGKAFADDARFAELIKTLPGPLELLVERDGKLRVVVLRFDAKPLERAA